MMNLKRENHICLSEGGRKNLMVEIIMKIDKKKKKHHMIIGDEIYDEFKERNT